MKQGEEHHILILIESIKFIKGAKIGEGVCKSKRDKLTVLDVIADDKKLIEGYLAILKEMSIKYFLGPAIQDSNFKIKKRWPKPPKLKIRN